MNGTEGLLELQETDSSIDRLEARRRELEAGEELRAARIRAEEADNEVGELRLALDSVEREQTRLDAEIESLSLKQQAEEKRLFDGSVTNAKELESIQAEVGGLKSRRGRIEDQLLEQMEKRENLEGRISSAESEAAKARTTLDTTGGDAARELEEIASTLEEKAKARAELAAAIDPDLLELYEDLRRQKKGVGAAALVDGVCQGCHQKLSAMELDRLKKSEGVKRCEYCRRILIFN
ncbi:MAG: C4-type zinc ribbon domain-containing protein [Actinomycetota bacterium]